jgi:hypothetical protein
MSLLSAVTRVVAVAALALLLTSARPAPARAGILQDGCSVLDDAAGALTKLGCAAVTHVSGLAKGARQLLSGHVSSAVKSVLGEGGSGLGAAATATAAFTALTLWVTSGASEMLKEVARYVSHTTSPQLQSGWFSAVYWQMAGIAALLTLPFLFACAMQAMFRGELSMLLSAAFGYLPAALLAIFLISPVVMLLLAAGDQLCSLVEHVGGPAGNVLGRTSVLAVQLSDLAGSRFLGLLLGLVVVAAALALWIELLARAAALYIVVLMLPLVFAALVWPARRIWALRLVELLAALILSKFVIVVVLVLGGSALVEMHTLTGFLAGTVLLILGAFSPWAILRLLPHVESAGAATSTIREGTTGRLGRALQSPLLGPLLQQSQGEAPPADGAAEPASLQAQVQRLTESTALLALPPGASPPAPAAPDPTPAAPDPTPAAPRPTPCATPDSTEPGDPTPASPASPELGAALPAPPPPPATPERSPSRRPWLPGSWTQTPEGFPLDDPNPFRPPDPGTEQFEPPPFPAIPPPPRLNPPGAGEDHLPPSEEGRA